MLYIYIYHIYTYIIYILYVYVYVYISTDLSRFNLFSPEKKGFLTFSGGIEMWHWTKMG